MCGVNFQRNLLKKLRVGYVYIEESFDTIFNVGYGRRNRPWTKGLSEEEKKRILGFSGPEKYRSRSLVLHHRKIMKGEVSVVDPYCVFFGLGSGL